MDVFLLGAGKPASGETPSALKRIALDTRALDWQIHSFEPVAHSNNIHFLGGYDIEEIVANYPQLNFTLVPHWQQHSILHTLLKAPFSGEPCMCAYSDTVFRKEQISEIAATNSDVVFAIDSGWRQRYASRSEEDIQQAETINLHDETGTSAQVEFTGLIYFSAKATELLTGLQEAQVGSNLIQLIDYLQQQDMQVSSFDISGHWAEFNSPNDIAQFILGTKADTLARLEPLVKHCHIGEQVSFTLSSWLADPEAALNQIRQSFPHGKVIVRSSARSEDSWDVSNAGNFLSLLNIAVEDNKELTDAITEVFNSYGTDPQADEQVLVQEFLQDVSISGVVFTCNLESGSPYYRFNFDDKSTSTESVTSGTSIALRTIILSRAHTQKLQSIEPELVRVLTAVQELELLLGYDKLDVEFAVDQREQVHIFQVRPIAVDHSSFDFDAGAVAEAIDACADQFNTQQYAVPFLHGDGTIFSNMSDWNPAEIIGIHPKPLALSLYRHLITNDIWARQRADFGYCDVRPSPLIFSFSGQPYVDLRASLNSFIPADLAPELAARLVGIYLELLTGKPFLHDKIEFDIAFTVWTPDFRTLAEERLLPMGLSSQDLDTLEAALKKITCNALSRLDSDLQTITALAGRRQKILASNTSVAGKIVRLLDDCRRFGTLAFAHAARAGFIARSLLRGLVNCHYISTSEELMFLNSIHTVASELEADRLACHEGKLSASELKDRYGHLRPGTYEVQAQAYWEDPAHYLAYQQAPKPKSQGDFPAMAHQSFAEVLQTLGSDISTEEFVSYCRTAIQERERVKFEFTRSVSVALDLCVELGQQLGLSRNEVSFLQYCDVEQLMLDTISPQLLSRQIRKRMSVHAQGLMLELPSCITSEQDFYCFERFASQPNFVTITNVKARTHTLATEDKSNLTGKIVLIEQADPGYDWLFAYEISGLITKYGGANSHMAIRAAELNLPAAIGVGEKFYESLTAMRQIELDCANKTIRELL